jgi:predicted transcriptional regulator
VGGARRFLTPSVLTRQYSMMPDGTTYFCFAKVTSQPQQGSLVRGTAYSIGLGTTADAAKHLAYAQDVPSQDLKRTAIPTGVTCRFCERTDCNQRAAPATSSPSPSTSTPRRTTSSRR